MGNASAVRGTNRAARAVLVAGGYVCGDYQATVEGGGVVDVTKRGAESVEVVEWYDGSHSGDHRFTMTVVESDGTHTPVECVAI